MSSKLILKITSKDATIGIIGLGYVGLPLVIRFSEEDFRVIGFDIDKTKVQKLNDGDSYLRHIPSSAITDAANNGFTATSDCTKNIQLRCHPHLRSYSSRST